MRISESEIRLDNTNRSAFVRCPKKFFLQRVKSLQPRTASTALRFGGTYHKMQEVYHKYILDNGYSDVGHAESMVLAIVAGRKDFDRRSEGKEFYEDYKTFEAAIHLFEGYISYFDTDKNFLEVVQPEHVFAVPVIPETEEERILADGLPPITYVGKIDLRIRLGGLVWQVEFKTTGWNIDLMASRLRRDPQIMGYDYAAKQFSDEHIEGTLVSIAMISARKNKDGVYGKLTTDYRRVPQIFTKADIASWKSSLISTCRDMYWCWQKDIWPMRYDSCYTYGVCPYTRLCEQNRPFDELNTEGYIEEAWDVENEDGE